MLPREVLSMHLGEAPGFRNLLSGRDLEFGEKGFSIEAYGCAWVVAARRDR